MKKLYDYREHGRSVQVETQNGARYAVLGLWLCDLLPVACIEGTPKNYPAISNWPHTGELPWSAFRGTLLRTTAPAPADQDTSLIDAAKAELQSRRAGRWRALDVKVGRSRLGIQKVRFEWRCYNTEPSPGGPPYVLYNMPGVKVDFLAILLEGI